MTSLVFRDFYFDYYSYRFRLGFGLGLGLGFELELGLRVSFFRLYYKMFARTERAPSLFLKVVYNDAYRILHGMPRYHSARERQIYYNIDSFYALQRKIT